MFWPLGRVFRVFLLVGGVLFFCGHTTAATRIKGLQLLKQRRTQVRRADELQGASVRDDGIEDVLIASSGDVVVVHADVGGFGAFSGVLGAAALVGCGEVFEGFAAGGVVGGVDAQLDTGVGGGFVLLGV